MGIKQLAAYITIASFVFLAVGIGLYDYRAGLITVGVCFAAAGVWTLKQE